MSSAIAPSQTANGFDRRAALRDARSILRRHGKSYYFSTCLFPRELQESTWSVYAFVRLPDEIVDNSPQETPEDMRVLREKLFNYLEEWRLAYQHGAASNPILQLAAEAFHRHEIPFEYSEAFLRAMVQDTEQSTYRDYADLEGYMYGSAAVIGLMMSHLIGFSDPAALHHARRLGEAMQLTNFLRDIDEDFQQRGRVYMPQDELAKFGLSTEDIAHRRFSRRFREFMRWQADRAGRLYQESYAGIPMLRKEGRFAVATAATLYSAILGKLEAQDWDPFSARAATSLPEKLWLLRDARRLSRR